MNTYTDSQVADALAALTPKQQRFVQEYVIDLNATQAAIRAGYSERGATQRGSELLANRNVARAIAERQQDAAARLGLTHEWVLGNLRELAERCMEARPVIDRRGNPVVGVWTFDSNGANRALELIGKHLQLFPKEAGTTVNVDNRKVEITYEDRRVDHG